MPTASCVLCGVLDDRTQVVNAESLHAIVKRMCIPTGFHYESFMSVEYGKDDGVRLCQRCMNWRKGCVRGRKAYSKPFSLHRKHREIYTPFDSVVMYALEPGHFAQPDQRTFHRLIHVVLSETNAFRSILPDTVREILTPLKGDSPDDTDTARKIAQNWFKVNEETQFFRNPCCAKAVRRALREPANDTPTAMTMNKTKRKPSWRK